MNASAAMPYRVYSPLQVALIIVLTNRTMRTRLCLLLTFFTAASPVPLARGRR